MYRGLRRSGMRALEPSKGSKMHIVVSVWSRANRFMGRLVYTAERFILTDAVARLEFSGVVANEAVEHPGEEHVVTLDTYRYGVIDVQVEAYQNEFSYRAFRSLEAA